MHKLAQNVLSASGGKRSPSDRDSENDETPELKKTKSEDIATATNTESPDVAESAIETVSSEAAAAAAPKFKYVVKAKNLPHGQVKEMKTFFTNLGFSKFSKAPNQTHGFLSFPVSSLLLWTITAIIKLTHADLLKTDWGRSTGSSKGCGRYDVS